MIDTLTTEDIKERFSGEAISAEKEISEKLIKAIGKDTYDRRWFWELLQNAIDSISEQPDGKLNIELKLSSNSNGEKTLVVTHDGGYFKPSKQKYRFDDFKNLINPTSGKPTEDLDSVGRFGTGFLATHRLSLKIDVRGTFQKQDGELVSLSTFLDRTSFLEKSEEARNKRIDALILALAEYRETINKAQKKDDWPIAEFTYHLGNKNETPAPVDLGFKEIRCNLPFIFAVVDKLNTVIIYDENSGDKTEYYRESVKELEINHVLINIKEKRSDESFSVLKISDDSKSILFKVETIELESKSFKFIDRHEEYHSTFGCFSPSLYCTYPLIGSEKFYLPFIVHSNSFEPNETRDQIDLKKESNQNILRDSLLLFDAFLTRYSLSGSDLWNVCRTKNWVDLDWVEKSWYENTFLKDLRHKIANTPLIKLSENEKINQIEINKCFFPDFIEAAQIGSDNDKKPSSIHYDLVFLLKDKMVPSYAELTHWLEVLWTGDDVQRISLNALIKEVATLKNINSFSGRTGLDQDESIKKMKDFLTAISKLEDNEKILTGHDQAIIPTVSGEFQEYPKIRKGIGFEGQLIEKILLEIHSTLLPSKKFNEMICETTIVEILNPGQIIEEKAIANEIAVEVDNLLSRHSDFVRELEKNEKNEDRVNKNEIESKLSTILNWISKFDVKRKYFKESQKRRILQAIIDEKDSPHLTSMLELHRTSILSLARQSEILSDEDLGKKLEEGQKMLEAIKEENETFEKLKKIGKHFEGLMKEMLIESFGPDNVKHVDGNQDFIIGNTHIELKTTSTGDYVKMHPKQADTAQKMKDKFYLCVFDYHKPYEQVTKEEFKFGLKFTNQIGEKLNNIVINMTSYEGGDDNIQVWFPEVYQSFKGMTPYKYIVKEAAWGNETFDEMKLKVLNPIK